MLALPRARANIGIMSGDSLVRAILGPTNTGKTYLAIERRCGHSSGVIGFQLRQVVLAELRALLRANAVVLRDERYYPR